MKKFYSLVLAMLMALGISSVASADPIVTVGLDFYGGDTGRLPGYVDTDVELLPGQRVMVDFVYSIEDPGVSGIGLWKAGFNLDFDPVILRVSNYQEYGDWLSYEGSGSGIMPDSGNVKFIGEYLASSYPAEGRIIGFQLTALAAGVTEIMFGDWDPDGPAWWAIDTVNGKIIIDDINFGSLTTVTTPIPGAVWLLGSGLLGLVGSGLRRKIKS